METGDTIMFTKITMALAIVLGVTSGALAATSQQRHGVPASNAYGTYIDNPNGCCFRGDAWDQLRQRNEFPGWAG